MSNRDDLAGATTEYAGTACQVPSSRPGGSDPGGTPPSETAPAVRGRAQTRAPGSSVRASEPGAGSRGLSGAEWRAAAAKAARKSPARPRQARTAAVPAGVPGGFELTATARCLSRQDCDWTAGPGDPDGVDKAAQAHTDNPPRHPTSTAIEPLRGGT